MRFPFILVAAILLAPFRAAAADPQEPELRHGLWKLKKLINQRPYESRQCMQPYAELLRRQMELKDSGCTYEVTRPADAQWQVTTRCRKQSAEGRRWESDTVTLMNVKSDTSYRMEVTGTTNTVPSSESIEAWWTGPCEEPAR